MRGGIETHERRRLHRRILLVGAVFVAIEIAEQQAFGDRLRRLRRSLAFARQESEPFHRARFQITHRGSRQPAQFGGVEFIALSGADQDHALRGNTRGKVDEGELQHFAGQFAGGGELAESAPAGPIEIGDNALDGCSLLLFGLKHIAHERLGLDLCGRPRIQTDLHAGSHRSSTPPVFVHGFAQLAPRFLFAFALAAVPLFFTACQGQFAFGNTIAKIDAQRNERQAFLLRFANQFLNFLAMQEQPATRERLMIERAAGAVLGNVAIHQPDAGSADFGVSIPEVRFAVAQSFHFGARQRHAGLHLLEQVVVVGSGAILGNDLLPRCILFGGFLSGFSHEGLS